MKNSKLNVAILFLVMMLVGTSVFAQSEKSARKGFYIGFAPQLACESSTLEKCGGGFSFQIGHGFNEHFILFADIQSHVYDFGDSETDFFDLMVKSNYIISQQLPFYLSAGVGITQATVTEHLPSGSYLSSDSSNSFVGQLAVGYEWRVGKKFFMAPELFYNYRHINAREYNTTGLSYRFGWYF